MNLAFLGCGFATRLHSRTLKRFAGIERYYASRDGAKAAEYARRYGGSGSFGSYAEAIGDPRVEVVLVATPPTSHLELTLGGLRAGKHVIVEKPPFLRATDFDEVERVAAEVGRRVFVAENYHYKPLARALRAVIAEGAIGEPRILTVNALKEQRTGDWRDERALAGGGALFEGGIHWVSFMAGLGLEVERVHAFRPGPTEGPERTVVVVLEYASGAVGTLYYSWDIGSPLRGLRLSALYGSQGTASFETNGLLLGIRGRTRSLRLPGVRDLLGYRAMFEDFFEALRSGRPAAFDLAAARRDLELVEAAYRSMERADTHSSGEDL